MGDIFKVSIHSTILNEINYKYELQCSIQGQQNVAQCYLLLGNKNETSVVRKCLQIPMSINESHNFEFLIDIQSFHKRYHLIRQVQSNDIVPLGIFLVNSKIFHYDEIIESTFVLNDLGLELPLDILFRYEPMQITNDINCSLECYQRDNESIAINFQRRIFEIIMDTQIEISNDVMHKRIDEDTNNGIITDSIRTYHNIDYSMSAFQEFNNINENEDKLVTDLIKRVDSIISFLSQTRYNPHIYNENYELLLRKVSILVSKLELEPTSDIENEILNKENEIKLLQIACNQWEMATPH
ncbi:similar to Saccharomyces cerevisiae YMR025W CSI1 Subunit of the Cop9 signalosome, which is required for deneddylation, or removal of the ubiquitin-like protein Rub1p from Cdc53p (cullin) [Maudiozyma barnettii]|uniref:Similar to Saccharomyces cerevisiae YMR025W CSI1 Subunit of the Cop9 signalosome, which is required for deneddylation, or removal of the ubiquitin-like protein Rub1p from Cdc53p (Cullin) n=1 Tax=Maudiozyma barnettii TaxID=61262 RepID=A0A8H2VJV8_9SACH|nr:Csi1p [Kazachstania barnettii]CAB4256910.1 similar to Saccharomyces cerevisiae YMR025W CSI1 Subunit of the Cop9 signalosome, which is required for deneddylation, or removal of the ubiquitin-like protein Rub1p from Cdc53p (cullin) [Kazachstania barnettii]CAD1785515.1 similar to Saccharomyces cerevisiae YMR025W CSI1 Subunit of the Cop9 signalosome, which is required for deneddylation, or removal of the ubiquitin-like protein Rub1p from Cdc53p (cullin) [Kazachstania barnettii]